MPFSTPSYSQLNANAIAEILASGQVPNGLLPISILRVLAQVVAENAYLHTEFLRWISLQSVPYTAEMEYLDSWSALVSIFRYPASSATATVQFSGTNGTVIPTGTMIQRIGDQTNYVTTTSTTIVAGYATASVISTSTGATTNGSAGINANLTTPISGLSSIAGFTTAATGGANAELDASLRTRMLAKFSQVGSAGSISDFTNWAFNASGISRVWVNSWGFGIGTICIYIMLDVQNAANNGFPLGVDGVATAETRWPQGIAAGDQQRAASAVYPLQPISSLVFVASPIPQHITVSVIGSSVPINATISANILTALESYLLSVASPLRCTVYLSGLSSCVQSVLGQGATFDLALPTADVHLPVGYLPLITAADLSVA